MKTMSYNGNDITKAVSDNKRYISSESRERKSLKRTLLNVRNKFPYY